MKARNNPFLALIALASASQGADLFWDANGTTSAAVGGTGNWSANAWRDGSTTGALGTWVDGNRPSFGTTAGIVTLNQNVAVSGLNFGVAGNEIRGSGANTMTFSGGTITGSPHRSPAASSSTRPPGTSAPAHCASSRPTTRA